MLTGSATGDYIVTKKVKLNDLVILYVVLVISRNVICSWGQLAI